MGHRIEPVEHGRKKASVEDIREYIDKLTEPTYCRLLVAGRLCTNRLRWVGIPCDPGDVVHDAMLALLEDRRHVELPEDEKQFVQRLIFLMLAMTRKLVEAQKNHPDVIALRVDPVDSAPTPAQAAALRQLFELVEERLSGDEEALAVALLLAQKYERQEIAVKLEIPASRVDAVTRRIRRRIGGR